MGESAVRVLHEVVRVDGARCHMVVSVPGHAYRAGAVRSGSERSGNRLQRGIIDASDDRLTRHSPLLRRLDAVAEGRSEEDGPVGRAPAVSAGGRGCADQSLAGAAVLMIPGPAAAGGTAATVVTGTSRGGTGEQAATGATAADAVIAKATASEGPRRVQGDRVRGRRPGGSAVRQRSCCGFWDGPRPWGYPVPARGIPSY